MASTENVRVVIRIRPFLQSETRDTPLQIRQQGIQITTPSQQPRQFQFDSVLPPQTSQAEVYDAAARDVVQNFVRGMNGCVLCYGQTSSGKTYTCGLSEPLTDGLVYRSLFNIFSMLRGQRFELTLTFVQIYNEQIQNLLNPCETDLTMREVQKNNFQIERLTTA